MLLKHLLSVASHCQGGGGVNRFSDHQIFRKKTSRISDMADI